MYKIWKFCWKIVHKNFAIKQNFLKIFFEWFGGLSQKFISTSGTPAVSTAWPTIHLGTFKQFLAIFRFFENFSIFWSKSAKMAIFAIFWKFSKKSIFRQK